MGILNVGTQALQANLLALQTIGNNIANVNTQGYSRQRVDLQAVQGQYTGSGYVGKGVTVDTITRNYDQFLTRQSTLANSVQAADVMRADYLKQLTDIFQGGTSGVGAAINDMLNAFSDVANTPTDLTARNVALTRVDEAARRMRAASQTLDDLQAGVTAALGEKVAAVNTLSQKIAAVNGEIATALGGGQTPNDLLDKRDQLIKDLGQYIQTTSIANRDGTVSVFVASSQAIVLGSTVAELTLVQNDFGDPQQTKLAVVRGATEVTVDENALGGGEISGMLRFQNQDLNEARNLLGRLTTAITTAMNDQHKLGVDLDGNAGGDLFTEVNVNNILTPQAPATPNAVQAKLNLAIEDPSLFAASDYLVTMTGNNEGTITRMSDGKTVASFTSIPNTAPGAGISFDGLLLSFDAVNSAGNAVAGDRFFLKPFSDSASNIAREFATPRALAVASPVVGQMGANNAGSLQLASLVANEPLQTNVPITVNFDTSSSPTRYFFSAANSFPGSSLFTAGTGPLPSNNVDYYASPTPYPEYKSGQAITSPETPNSWTLTLQGAPKAGDTFTVRSIADPAVKVDRTLNGGNALAMMALRDKAMFDGAVMTDGYASLISQIGIRTQSANYSAEVSSNIATNAEQNRTGVSGVNLDEEAGKLLQYQQAYQASAKMIQVAQSIFDTLVQTIMR